MDFNAELDKLKQHVFFGIMEMTGRVYVIVHYSESVKIGNRGFTKNEKAGGLVLVFNESMDFQWIDGYIDAKLSFGAKVERCLIPSENIVVIFSPDVNIRLLADFKGNVRSKGRSKEGKISTPNSGDGASMSAEEDKKKDWGKVIEVDFSKKRK